MNNFSLNFLTFPVWWYSVGIKIVWHRFVREWHYRLHSTGLLVFARHLREPLYGDHTRSGIILSFFLRIILLVFKLIVFILRMLIALLLVATYLLLLPFIIIMIVLQLVPGK